MYVLQCWLWYHLVWTFFFKTDSTSYHATPLYHIYILYSGKSAGVLLAYRKIYHISRTLVGNKIADNSDVVWASPVGAAPTTSSFSTQHLASMDGAKTTARLYKKHLNFRIWCDLYWRFYGSHWFSLRCLMRWINHSPPVRWSNFRFMFPNKSLVCLFLIIIFISCSKVAFIIRLI